MPTVPVSRTSKTNDDGDYVTGVASDINGPADLRGCTLRFLAKSKNGSVVTIIDSANGDGVCVNVEDETEDEGNRGRYRFEPNVAGIDVSGLYAVELEVALPAVGENPPKKITFPSEEALNPNWKLDPDIA